MAPVQGTASNCSSCGLVLFAPGRPREEAEFVNHGGRARNPVQMCSVAREGVASS